MAPLGIFFLALGVRVAWWWSHEPVDWSDTPVYLASGRSLLETGFMSTTLYMPGYPLLLALLGPDHILFAQMIVSAATAALAVVIARRIYGRSLAGWIAGLLVATSPLLIFYSTMRLTETCFTFLVVAAMAAGYGGRYALAALCLVAAIMVRPAIDYVAPLLLLAFLFANRERLDGRILARVLLIYAGFYLAAMIPWWVHNYQLYGTFVRLNLGDGIHWLLENNPVFPRVGFNFLALAEATGPFDPIEDPIARRAAMIESAFAYIGADPWRYLAACIDRLGRFWSPLPGSDNPKITLTAFAMTAPLMAAAVISLARSWERTARSLVPLLLLTVFLTLLHAATHALPRYRLPLEPLVMVMAAGWLAEVVTYLWQRVPMNRSRGRHGPVGQGRAHGRDAGRPFPSSRRDAIVRAGIGERGP